MERDIMGRPIQEQGRELDWDSVIEKDSTEFTLLPAGEYPFEVVGFERGRYSPGPGAKLPPCSMAVLTLDVGGDQAMARITHRLFLHSRCEGMLCAFFTAIGQRKHGERHKMEWSQVVGSAGRCRVGVREYTNSQGETRKINQIERFLEPAGPGGAPDSIWKPGKF